MKKEKLASLVVIIILTIGMIFTMGSRNNNNPKSVYEVFLNGERIGLVDNKESLLNMINQEQQDIKDKYNVNKVYPPNGFHIENYITYNEKICSAEEIYKKIQKQSDFTIEGYIISIKKQKTENEEEKTTKIYVLDDNVFKDAEKNLVLTFVDEDTYNAYMTNTQEEIKTTGSLIKHMEFAETVTIKEGYIPSSDKIFTDSKELTKYLLYGTTEQTSTYTVKQGDTLQSIAHASKLNVRELLIANPEYRAENAVLAIGDTVRNDIINPILNLYEEVKVIEDVEQAYTKTTITDSSLAYGKSEVVQNGVTGINRITQELRIINGERSQETNVIATQVIREMVEEITKVGQKQTYNWGGSRTGGYVDTGLDWGWPTNQGYIITTDYEYRWGSFHNAIDISGTGCGSPIYATRPGTVVATYTACANTGWYGSMCGGSYGNYVVIKHENNFYTMNAHLYQNVQVSPGQTVQRGQVIGYMGSSGSSTGCHLHYGLSYGYPDNGGTWYNPWSMYR